MSTECITDNRSNYTAYFSAVISTEQPTDSVSINSTIGSAKFMSNFAADDATKFAAYCRTYNPTFASTESAADNQSYQSTDHAANTPAIGSTKLMSNFATKQSTDFAA